MIAKVNFNLISREDKGMTYSYRTNNVDLKGGDIVTIDGIDKVANFVGYVESDEGNVSEYNISKLSSDLVDKYWKDVEERLLKDPLWMSDYAYDYYTENFLRNENTSFEDARKKITRNVILSRSFGKDKPKIIGDVHVFFYGTMEIGIKGNMIVRIRKLESSNKKFTKNKRKYHYLNEHFGIVGK